MTINVYSLKDEVDRSYGAPVLFSNDATAMRAFENAYHMQNSIYQTAPQDFTLYRIATFDLETGEMITKDHFRVCSCVDFARKE